VSRTDTKTGRKGTKLRKFTREYLKDFNATRSAVSVGASKRSAHVLGCRWLTKVKESGLYDEESAKALESVGVSLHGILNGLAGLAHSNMSDYVTVGKDGQADVNLAGLSREQMGAIQEITVDATGGSGDGERRRVLRTRFKLADRGSNLERLAKIAGFIVEKKSLEHTGPGGGPIQTAIEVSFKSSNASES
jgi:phage terminase small subunit